MKPEEDVQATIRLPSREELDATGDVELAVRQAATRLAVDRFRSAPAHPVRWMTRLLHPCVALRVGGPPSHTSEALARDATALDFKLLGEERVGVVPSQYDVWMGPRGLVQLQVGDRGYRLTTYFDDGSCVATWSGATKAPSAGKLVACPGTGELARDYAVHDVAVQQLVDTSRRPLFVEDLETCVALERHYYRDVIPLVGPAVALGIAAWGAGALLVGGVTLLLVLRGCD